MTSKLANTERQYVVDTLSSYWHDKNDWISRLPVPEITPPFPLSLPPKMDLIQLPDWANDVGVEGKLLVPCWANKSGNETAWNQTDWFSAAFWYLNGSAERAHENIYGPIHSYSFRLKNWDPRIWEKAWVNRIALFLRRWAAKEEGVDENQFFGSLPTPEIFLTHDVDAVNKTLAIRFKQAAFHFLYALRNVFKGYWLTSAHNIFKGAKFLFSRDDYWCFEKILKMEEQVGVQSHFNFYGGQGGWARSLKEQILDPAYNVQSPKIQKKIKDLHYRGWKIGLHPSFDSWEDPEKLLQEKEHLETALGDSITICRQHWLRFSWATTWKNQASVGFGLDTTMGFNDRLGFRNGTALKFKPWNAQHKKAMRFLSLPMILMDSHLYDYNTLSESERAQEMERLLDELKETGGTGSIIWHQQVFNGDYAWGEGYRNLLKMLNEKKILSRI